MKANTKSTLNAVCTTALFLILPVTAEINVPITVAIASGITGRKNAEISTVTKKDAGGLVIYAQTAVPGSIITKVSARSSKYIPINRLMTIEDLFTGRDSSTLQPRTPKMACPALKIPNMSTRALEITARYDGTTPARPIRQSPCTIQPI